MSIQEPGTGADDSAHQPRDLSAPGDGTAGAPAGSPLLDAPSFSHRAAAELARVRRSGGFLSLAVFRPEPGGGAPEASLLRVAEGLRSKVRLHDVLGRLGRSVGLLMPDTTMNEAARATERLIGALSAENTAAGALPERLAAGIASVYGDVEGDADALSAAAEEALDGAAAGEIARSATLDGRPRVLVVDDDLSFARVLAAMISQRGWEGHPCSDPTDARQRVRDGAYSALMVDLMLPGVSGVDILREAMARRPGRPAVLMSSKDTDHGSVLDALELGPVMFIRKPVVAVDLDQALQMFRNLLPGAGRLRA